MVMADLSSHDLLSSKPFVLVKISWYAPSSHRHLPTSDGIADYELRLTPLIHLGFLDLPLWLLRTFQHQLLVSSLVEPVDLVQAIQVVK